MSGGTVKRNVDTLKRRKNYLADRIKDAPAPRLAYDRAEVDAISFALRMIEEFPEEAREVLRKHEADKAIYKTLHGVNGA